MFDSAIQQEALVAKLPTILHEAKVADIDQVLEERLQRLKFFNQTWLTSAEQLLEHDAVEETTGKYMSDAFDKGVETVEIVVENPINLNSDLISEKSDDTFEGPKADDDIDTAARKEFNTWYAEQLETKMKGT